MLLTVRLWMRLRDTVQPGMLGVVLLLEGGIEVEEVEFHGV